MKQEDLKGVLNALFSGLATSTASSYKDIADLPTLQAAEQSVKNGDLEMFWSRLSYPLEQMVDGLLMSALPQSDDAQFLFKEYQFIESHFNEIIKQVEGWPFSSDKSRTLMNALLKFMLTGTPIEFNYDQKITYHLPRQVFTEHAVIVQFFNGLRALRFGQSKPFIEAIAAAYKSVKPLNNGVNPNEK